MLLIFLSNQAVVMASELQPMYLKKRGEKGEEGKKSIERQQFDNSNSTAFNTAMEIIPSRVVLMIGFIDSVSEGIL